MPSKPTKKLIQWLHDGAWNGRRRRAGQTDHLPAKKADFLIAAGIVKHVMSKPGSVPQKKTAPTKKPQSKAQPNAVKKPKPAPVPKPRKMQSGEKSERRRKTLLYKYKRRKYMVGYGVWNKQDMIGWMIDGVAEWMPTASEVRFVFDHCVDDSEMMFDMCAGGLLGSSKTITKYSGPEVKDEIGVHDSLMRYFVQETDCDVLIVMQDDQRFSGPVVPRLEPVLHHLKDRVGVIGARLGYEFGLTKGIASQWGGGVNRAKLPVGGWAECTYLNTGPIIYPRSTIEKVGYLDRQFEHWFIWEDYCARCKYDHNLVNVVVDADMRHVKFGRKIGSSYYTDKSSTRDRARIHKKWGRLGW